MQPNITAPNDAVYFTVQANVKWAMTGYNVLAGSQTTILWVSGQWSVNPQWGYLVTGTGNPNLPPSKPGYALPGAPEAALVGMVNNQVFLIGNRGVVPSNLTGLLYLAANDDLNGRYGPGYVDNVGSLKVMIFNTK